MWQWISHLPGWRADPDPRCEHVKDVARGMQQARRGGRRRAVAHPCKARAAPQPGEGGEPPGDGARLHECKSDEKEEGGRGPDDAGASKAHAGGRRVQGVQLQGVRDRSGENDSLRQEEPSEGDDREVEHPGYFTVKARVPEVL